MKTDEQLKADVNKELEWDPSINSTHVGVAVLDGVVTLTGHLDTYAEKYAVERAVQRVEGVRAIAMELDVKLEPGHRRSDSEIAQAAETALKWHAHVPDDRIQVKVEKGWLTLRGEVDWDYQRQNAERALRPLTGVVGVSNGITLKTRNVPVDIARRIKEALIRHAEKEAEHVEIKINGPVVTLQGHVDSWSERAAASTAVWSAPGVSKVLNQIQVRP